MSVLQIRGCKSAGGGAGPSVMGDIPALLQQLDTFRIVLGGSQGGDSTAMARAASEQQLPSTELQTSTTKNHRPVRVLISLST